MKPIPVATACLILLFVFSCTGSAKKEREKPHAPTSLLGKITQKKQASAPMKPVFGYRFVITGDFDGDGKQDTLTERFISAIDHNEIDKFHYDQDSEWDDVYAMADSNKSKKPIATLNSNNNQVNSLLIDSSKRSFGLAYLKNEGDLDGDGGDEISYVVNWADASSVNFCSVMTYKNHKWQRLYDFQMRDWQLPDLPEINDQYHAAGMHKNIADTTNQRLERELNAFKGFITRVGKNKIKVITFTEIGDADTVIVNLKSRRRK